MSISIVCCRVDLPNAWQFPQALFDSKIILARTDYDAFSRDVVGRLPGLDIAFLRDSVPYHTSRDTVDRIERGAIQVRRMQYDYLFMSCGGVLYGASSKAELLECYDQSSTV